MTIVSSALCQIARLVQLLHLPITYSRVIWREQRRIEVRVTR
nr:MAG TPA: hypothetical protein [Caudoviricetes sp.]